MAVVQLTAENKRKLRRQLDVWRSELMSTDRRQRLLYFRHLKVGSLDLVTPTIDELPKVLSLQPVVGLAVSEQSDVQVDADLQTALSRSKLKAGGKTATTLKSSLTRLWNQSHQVYADRGYWTLYLGIGMLTWHDAEAEESADAPLILLPVTLHRDAVQAPFTLGRAVDEDILVNPALKLKLERDFSLALPDIDPDEDDLAGYLRQIENLVAPRQWPVRHSIVLAQFSFHKEAIYRDLLEHEKQVLDHPLVQQIALGPDAVADVEHIGWDPASDDMDLVAPPEALHTILDSDSSQRACIVAARDGHNFVMDGPPGTGKSQTIANVIAELMAQGRSVLFVSEKAAALDVVRDRLGHVGLGDFLLELHSHAATRKEVVQQLEKALRQRVAVAEGFSANDRATLKQRREKLSAYAEAMNEEREGLGRRLIDVLGEVLRLVPAGGTALADLDAWGRLTSQEFEAIKEIAGRLGRSWRPVDEGPAFLWWGLERFDHSTAERMAMQEQAGAASRAAEAVDARVSAVDRETGASFSRDASSMTARLRLLQLLDGCPEAIDARWLGSSEQSSALARLAEVSLQWTELNDGQVALEKDAGRRWHELDVESLTVLQALLQRADVEEHSWAGGAEVPSSRLTETTAFLEQAPLALAPIVERADELASLLGISPDDMTLERAQRLSSLARLGALTARPDRTWLNPVIQDALDESSRVLAELVEVVRARQSAIREVFKPDALDIDLGSMQQRFESVHTGARRYSSAARKDRKLLRTVTVSGKASKNIVAMLGEANAWQQAEQKLTAAEGIHAPRLGGYYQRTDTDFSRLLDAVEAAHQAVQLAGANPDVNRLAAQLAEGADPDPRLLSHADDISRGLHEWEASVRGHLSDRAVTQVLAAPLRGVWEWCADEAADLLDGVAALASVADVCDRDVALGEATQLLARARDSARAAAHLLDEYDSDQELFGSVYRGGDTHWADVERGLRWAGEVVACVGEPLDEEGAEQILSHIPDVQGFDHLLATWRSARQALLANFDPDRAADLTDELDLDVRDEAELLMEMSESAGRDISEWDDFAAAEAELEKLGLSNVTSALVERSAPADDVVPFVSWAVLQAWTEAIIAGDRRLHPLRARDREVLVEEFRTLDRQMVDSAYVDVAIACASRRPRSLRGPGAVMLQREAAKKTRHKPIRQVLSEAGDIVGTLKPCFMMSPLSVSQFLPGDMRFDVVIFDEASQVLPSDAVNCIYRGEQLIVSGDDKQLPPTAFFQTAGGESDDADEDEPDEFESILSVCKSGVMPQMPLSWHYRSQHEDLITYSNYRFYAPNDQPLQSFPGAVFDAPDLGVASFVVDGVYKRGASRDNPVEAEAVVDRIEHHAGEHPHLSIGVVTLSTPQQDAVLACLERRAQDSPSLAALLADEDRLSGFFVKSIENVQGDERDLIILSIGYGKDEAGKLTNNFGAINGKAGWRRLNVAITRARRRVEVVSSIRAGDISGTTNDSILHLRAYLDFAARGVSALALELDESDADVDSAFEAEVLNVIQSWGYKVVPQVGVAGYRIDLGVRHPDRPGEYVLGIECDGAAYHSARSARDRDRLRASVLENLGWNLHRIWGISWYREREDQEKRLRAAVEAAIGGAATSRSAERQRPSAPIMESFEPSDVPDWAVTYSTLEAATKQYVRDLGAYEGVPALRQYLTRLVRAEAPIHLDVVHRRVRDHFGVGRIGHLIRANIDLALNGLPVDGEKVRRGRDGIIRLGRPGTVIVRVPEDDQGFRKFAEVPREELAEAVALMVRDSVSIDEDSLKISVARLFGWRRLTNDAETVLTRAIRDARKAGTVVRGDGGRLRAPVG